MAGLLVGDVFANAARAVPDRVAAAFRSQALTFLELDQASNGMVRSLLGLGVRRGDRIVCRAEMDLNLPVLFAACAKLGAVFTPVTAAAEAVAAADTTLVLERPPDQSTDNRPLEFLPELSENDPQVCFYTSGSSGEPKPIELSHRVQMLRTLPGAQLEPRGVMVCTFPLFHMAGWTVSLQQWQARDGIVYLERADGAGICDAVESFEATRLYCVPAVWQRVLDQHRVLPSLRFADTGTSATSIELLDAIAQAAPNAVVRVFYGSTEAGNVASATREELAAHPGSCGVPATLTQIRIDDGELCVCGPLVFTDGWHRTGDLATLDPAGYLHITGRTTDLIRTGGEAVAPTDVEAALAGCPGVAEAAVIGFPDSTWGEIVCAVIVPTNNPPTLTALREWCAPHLAPHQLPRALRLVDSLPKTPATGQIQRRALVEALAK